MAPSLVSSTAPSNMEIRGGNSSSVPLLTYVAVLGWPGANFYILHIVALVSLGISIVSSIAVFAILRPTCPSFWSRSAGERFAVYLALADLLYSGCHTLDHIYMLSVSGHPPDDACIVMAYFVATPLVIQALMVTFMAFNAFILVVKEVKISLGKYDWKLLMGTVALPFLAMIPPAILKWLGPSGGWCVYDLRREMGRILSIILSSINTLTIVINIVCYGFIFMKIKRVTSATQEMGQSTSVMKHQKAVQVMMKFVAAYIFQWWSHAVYAIWSQVATCPFYWILLMVIIINNGGFYNLVVYTLLRRMGPTKDKSNVKGEGPSKGQNTKVNSTNGADTVSK